MCQNDGIKGKRGLHRFVQSPFLLQAIQFFTSLVRLNAILQRTGEAALAIFASGLLWFLTARRGHSSLFRRFGLLL